MLTEINCELFMADGKPRGSIFFKEGLNIILGGGTGANSIGKSTMLLIVDFAFGGNTYTNSDAVKELGNHTINFTFRFKDTNYKFSRDTADPNQVLSHLDNKTIPIEEFTNWLRIHYNLDLNPLSFRTVVSRYFRIYGKDNYDEFRPLQIKHENMDKAISVLVVLYGFYDSVAAFREQYKIADEKLKIFNNARKHNFLPSSTGGQTKYKENMERISDLQIQRFQLKNSIPQKFDQEEVEKANHFNELDHRIKNLRRSIRNHRNDLKIIENNIALGGYPTEADLSKLQEFFPDANFKKITEIEQFHNKIQILLADELHERRELIIKDLEELESQLQAAQIQYNNLNVSQIFTEEFLDQYTSIDREIHHLESENKAFDEHSRLTKNKKEAAQRMENHYEDVLNQIQESINNQMEEISNDISDNRDRPPKLTLNKHNSYDFRTPSDTGTGTNYKGMIIYDIAVLLTSPLPALSHDSLLFSDISNEYVAELIKWYTKIGSKQAFISFDKQDMYDDEEMLKIMDDNTVLKLGDDEQALFGKKWSRK
ncbi:DUF2326 domain-containing protein [Eremococcus coleocola]|uniref:DUF2326 domain-containing protein n=1 Tax=Eremococcus coleocola TaxID=88132 RepID=UPI0004119C7A|nr:DUF2326 domain-containing protein [Eremococcus coleocola]